MSNNKKYRCYLKLHSLYEKENEQVPVRRVGRVRYSPAALATTVGVLTEVPVMLLLCRTANRTKGWFDNEKA